MIYNDPSECRYGMCHQASVMIVAYGLNGAGACDRHVLQVIRWCQGGEQTGSRTAQGVVKVEVYPAWLWLEDK